MKKGGPNHPVFLPNIKDWHAVLIISSLVAFFFRDILLKDSFFWEDFLYQFYPFRNFAAVSLAMGELPLWNPFTFSGTPFQADIQSALFYLPNLLLTLFVSGGKLSYFWLELQIILHLMLGGIGTYYLAKDHGMKGFSALFSGVAFALSGFMITHAIHQVIICQVAWFPLILLMFRRALMRRSVTAMFVGGLTLGNAILAGFPQVSLYIFLFLLFYFLFEIFSGWKTNLISGSFKMSALAAGFVAVALAYTAVQLLPTIELAPLSQRAAITYEKSQEGQLSWEQIVTVLMPKYFGSSGAQGSTYWGPGAYWVYWETCFYVGIPALMLLLFSLTRWRSDKYILFYLGAGIFALLYALGDNFIIHDIFFHHVPGFDKFRSVGRMTLLSTFGFSMLAGYGMESVAPFAAKHPKRYNQALIGLAALFITVFLLAGSGWLQGGVDGRLGPQVRALASSSAMTMLIVSLLAVALLYFIPKRFSSALLFFGLLTLQFVDLNIFGFSQNNGEVNPDEYYGRTRDLVSFIKEQGKNEYFRVNSRRENAMILDRNQGMVDRIFLMEGYTPLSLQRIYPPVKDFDRACDILNAKFKLEIDPQRGYMSLAPSGTYIPRAYFVYDSKIMADEDSVRAFMMDPGFDPRSVVVLEEDPGFEAGGNPGTGSATISSYSLNEISLKVETSKNGFLMISDIFYPGWKAYIDGKPSRVLRADWSLRAVPVGAGRHQIIMKFEPESFRTGAWITGITIFGSSSVIIFFRFRKKNN